MDTIPVIIQEYTEIRPICQKERHTGTKTFILTRVTHIVLDNIEPHDWSFIMEQSSKVPPRNPGIELSETEDSIWNELPYKEEQTQPTLPPYATSSISNGDSTKCTMEQSSCTLTDGSSTFVQCIWISKNRLRFATTAQQVYLIC